MPFETPFTDESKIFTGNAHPRLAQEICDYLHVPLGKIQVFKFKNENTFVRIGENIRQRDVFLIQPTAAPVNDNYMELFIMIDAAKRASAGRITAVIPYYGYGRTDKKDQPRVPITARLVADLLTAAGAHRVLTVDLHAGQIQGFFNIPLDELSALPTLARYFKTKALPDLTVVATDIGISKRARNLAERLNAPLAIIEKRRSGNNDDKAETLNVIGEVKDRVCLMFDDEVDTGGSLLKGKDRLEQNGAKAVYACATHGVLSGDARAKIQQSTLAQLVITDTISQAPSKAISKIVSLSVAPLLAEAIRRIHLGDSIGELIEQMKQ